MIYKQLEKYLSDNKIVTTATVRQIEESITDNKGNERKRNAEELMILDSDSCQLCYGKLSPTLSEPIMYDANDASPNNAGLQKPLSQVITDIIAAKKNDLSDDVIKELELFAFFIARNNGSDLQYWLVLQNLYYKNGIYIYQDLFTGKMMYRQNGTNYELKSNVSINDWQAIYHRSFRVPKMDKNDVVYADVPYRKDPHPVIDVFAHHHTYNSMAEHIKQCAKMQSEDGGIYDGAWLIDKVFGREYVEYPDIAADIFQTFMLKNMARTITTNPNGYAQDEMIVLEGAQGIGKSEFCKQLVGEDYWILASEFGDTESSKKDVVQKLLGKRIVEVAELRAITKGEVANIKNFLSARNHTERFAFRKDPQKIAVTTSFIGTTNDKKYLSDTTGNRRFWPVELLYKEEEPLWDLELLVAKRDLMQGYFYNLLINVPENEWLEFCKLPPSTLAFIKGGYLDERVIKNANSEKINKFFADDKMAYLPSEFMTAVFGADVNNNEYQRRTCDAQSAAHGYIQRKTKSTKIDEQYRNNPDAWVRKDILRGIDKAEEPDNKSETPPIKSPFNVFEN